MTSYHLKGIYCTLAVFASILFLSCGSSGTIPFPEKELGYTQPVEVPLQFTKEKTLVFDTAKRGGIKPVLRKMDLNALPSAPFDTAGFRQFTTLPDQVHF